MVAGAEISSRTGQRFDSVPGHQSKINPGDRSRPISSLTYSDAASLYVERGFLVIPVRGKRPVPAGSTGRSGEVTAEKIAEWIADPDWGSQNLAIRHSPLTIAVDVDDYADKHGAEQLAELEARLGPLPATPSSTSRGKDAASRQHVFTLPEPVELVGKAADDIDIIQAKHRYSMAWPSRNPDADDALYQWYDADGEPMDGPPHIDDLEMLPEAWIEALRAGDTEHLARTEQWDGDAPDEAGMEERRKLRAIIGMLEGLPDVWAPGAGWHDVVWRSAAWLCRIANSNAYALTHDRAVSILLEHTPTYGSEWGTDKIIEQWESAVTSNKGRYEEPPVSDRPPLLPPLDVLNLLPAELYELTMREPNADNDGARWDLRHRIMRGVLQAGLDEVMAASAAWHAPNAGTPLRNDRYGEEKLWREVDQARQDADAATGKGIEAAPAAERPALVETKIELLTVTERATLAGDAGRWWGTRYLEWVETRVPVFNGPYHRMNRWHILSLVLSPYGFIPKTDGPMGLNLFSMVLGNTTTGKSQSKKLAKSVIRACYPMDSPDIGGDATANALVEKLIERDGKASWFNADEAHGLFKEMQTATWRGGLQAKWTDLYEGEVPSVLRSMKKDISGVHAATFFTMHLMGTESGMIDVIDREMWESGFLARFVWAIGDPNRINPRTLAVDQVASYEGGKTYDAMPSQWAAEFAAITRPMSAEHPQPLMLNAEALARYKRFQDLLPDIYEGHKLEAMLAPTLNRFNDTVRKCAGLVALSEGKFEITVRHLLIALEQAEEWLANAVAMIRRTTETGLARDMDAIEVFVSRQPGGMVPKEKVYLHMSPRLDKFDTDRLLMNLVAQGRIYDEPTVQGGKRIRIKREEGVAA